MFYHERLNRHYGVAVFILSNYLSSFPFLVAVAGTSGTITYFMVKFHSDFSHYAYIVLNLFSGIAVIESLMMIVASFVPDFLMGIITGAGIQGLMILSGGFFRLPDDLPKPFWRYRMYYIAFHKYATHGVYKNELIGLTFPSSKTGEPPITREQILTSVRQVDMGHSKWVDLAILFGMVVL